MQYSFAPMEGLTDSIYRRLHASYFPGIDRYYMPFFSPTMHRVLTPREDRELPFANQEPFIAVPQVLTKNAEDFLWAAQVCCDRGYDRINLNLGCPSGTVVSKGKGSGMLSDPCVLDSFLDSVCSRSPIPVSVKTRIGIMDETEFPALMEIFSRYPIVELIIHPRLRKDFYNAPIHFDVFDFACQNSKHSICYNGNLCTLKQIDTFSEQYPGITTVMIGRGLIADPGMLSPGGTTVTALEGFFSELLDNYITVFGSARNAMFRLKENWRYLLCRFEDSEKLGKRLKKTTNVDEYKAITREIFHNLELKSELTPDW